MQLILTPAGGGQPVTLNMPGSTEQGALNVTGIVPAVGAGDLLLIVQNGVLAAFQIPASLMLMLNPSPFDLTAPNYNKFLLRGVA